MRSRFYVLFVATGFVVAALFLFLTGTSSLIQAQGVTATSTIAPSATPSVVAVDATNNRGAFLTRVSDTLGLPTGSVFDIHSIADANITLDTQAAIGVACSSVVVYRETVMGDLVAHPSSCAGDILTFNGTGGFFNVDYFVVAFSSTANAQAAPASVVRNLGVQSLPVLGGASPSTSSTVAPTPMATMAATP